MVSAGSDEAKVDEVSMMLALSVLVLDAPADVVLVPNLQYPCINYFQQCFQSDNMQVSSIAPRSNNSFGLRCQPRHS